MNWPSDDSPCWAILSGLIVMGTAAIMLWGNYCQWDTPKDLTTIVAVGTAYFAAHLGKRLIRGSVKKRKRTERRHGAADGVSKQGD